MKKVLTIMATALLAVFVTTATGGEAPAKPDDVFQILESGEPEQSNPDSLGNAIGTLESALDEVETGEVASVQANLAYNRGRLEALRKQAAAKQDYVDTLWQKVAEHFEQLKKQYGGDENDTAYRKAVLSLEEEYAQRESAAKRDLERVQSESGVTVKRIAELESRLKIARLGQDLRSRSLASTGTTQSVETATPSRADGALTRLEALSKRKLEASVETLTSSFEMRDSVDTCLGEMVSDMTGGK